MDVKPKALCIVRKNSDVNFYYYLNNFQTIVR